MDQRRPDDDAVARDSALPPESAAAHLEAIAKGINDFDIVVQGLLSSVPPTKPWQRQLLAHLAQADRHVEILRLCISMNRDAPEIREAAGHLKQTLQATNGQTGSSRADGWTKNAVIVALHAATLVSALLAP